MAEPVEPPPVPEPPAVSIVYCNLSHPYMFSFLGCILDRILQLSTCLLHVHVLQHSCNPMTISCLCCNTRFDQCVRMKASSDSEDCAIIADEVEVASGPSTPPEAVRRAATKLEAKEESPQPPQVPVIPPGPPFSPLGTWSPPPAFTPPGSGEWQEGEAAGEEEEEEEEAAEWSVCIHPPHCSVFC